MKRSAEFRILAPLTRGWKSKAADLAELQRMRYAKYRVTVALPLVDRPRTRTRIMAGWQLHDYMRLHAGELAEFIVSVAPVGDCRRLH